MKTFKEYLKKTVRDANLLLSLASDTVGNERRDKSIILVGDQIGLDYPGSEANVDEGCRTPKAHSNEENEREREEQT